MKKVQKKRATTSWYKTRSCCPLEDWGYPPGRYSVFVIC